MAVKVSYKDSDVLPQIEDILLPRENGMMLSDKHIRVLENNNINYKDYKNIKEILFAANELNLDDDELEEVLKDLEEIDYYSRLVN